MLDPTADVSFGVASVPGCWGWSFASIVDALATDTAFGGVVWSLQDANCYRRIRKGRRG